MAVVKFSADLRNTIVDNAHGLFSDKINKAVNEFDSTWADRIFQIAYAPYMDNINALPKNWFHYVDKVQTNNIAGVVLDQSIELKLSTPMPIPVTDLHKTGHSPISISKDGYYITNLKTPDDEVYDDIKTEVLAYKNKITLLTERRTKFVSGVKELVYAHNTLAPALKAWQPLWDLLPQVAKDRHNLKVERNAKVDVQLSADLNSLTATIVASKIGA